ncbi:hypothetical protein GCM10011494_01230 [Novosphingobium endophyticum]|uniref:Uncharacterized protein n=1 Tax=Novosphingobium endophyticum TaxID=1955250 RepID=A0A916TNS2_9SPHN|nr:hypothetical protein GCM10011494_01230 [Novosphingobium endophyticum]
MDLNELLARHQIALLDWAFAASAAARSEAEERANLSAMCVLALKRRTGAAFPLIDLDPLKEMYACPSPSRNASLTR